MIFDHKFEDFEIEYPVKDYGNWLIAEIRNRPPHLAEYILRGNRVYMVADIQELPELDPYKTVFKVKFDWCRNIFIDIDGNTLEVVQESEGRNFKQATLNYLVVNLERGIFTMEIIDEEYPLRYSNLLKQAYFGLSFEDNDISDFYFVFSLGENFHFIKQTINGEAD